MPLEEFLTCPFVASAALHVLQTGRVVHGQPEPVDRIKTALDSCCTLPSSAVGPPRKWSRQWMQFSTKCRHSSSGQRTSRLQPLKPTCTHRCPQSGPFAAWPPRHLLGKRAARQSVESSSAALRAGACLSRVGSRGVVEDPWALSIISHVVTECICMQQRLGSAAVAGTMSSGLMLSNDAGAAAAPGRPAI